MAAKLNKKKKPKFLRPNYGRKSRARIKCNWRKPRGTDNKKRINKAHMGKSPSIGYGQAKSVKFLHPLGKKEKLVQCMGDFSQIKPNEYVLRIASSIGGKLREKILQSAKSSGFAVLNPNKLTAKSGIAKTTVHGSKADAHEFGKPAGAKAGTQKAGKSAAVPAQNGTRGEKKN